MPIPAGALRLWHAELRAGYGGQVAARPASWRLDALYRAACCEANGIDAIREGLPGHATLWFAKAAAILIDEANARRRAA